MAEYRHLSIMALDAGAEHPHLRISLLKGWGGPGACAARKHYCATELTSINPMLAWADEAAGLAFDAIGPEDWEVSHSEDCRCAGGEFFRA